MNDEEAQALEVPLNYYRGAVDSYSGLRYRLDGSDVVEDAINILKGGVKRKVGNKIEYNTEFRLMNDLGIQRARMIMQAGVNKINHLTKYNNEDRIFKQVKSIVKAWLFEVTLNMKRWSPNATFDDKGRLINKDMSKIKNKRLVIQTVENAILQSMQRGNAGFEAGLTAKSWAVHEVLDDRQREKPRGMLTNWFNRGRDEYR